jgi:hypothetical protein
MVDTQRRSKTMCLSCGCGEPNEKHGDDRNITMEDMQKAAQASNIPPMKAAQNIMNGMSMPQTGDQQSQQAMEM